MKEIENKNTDQSVLNDPFLKTLFKEEQLAQPSENFTANIMAKLKQKQQIVIDGSLNAVGKKITYLIFGLIALLNVSLLYLIWPYLSVWLPEEGILSYLLDNLNNVLINYAQHIFSRTFSLSLLFIIVLSSISLFGMDDFLRKYFHKIQNSHFLF
jgi:hypothetical protein